MNDLRDSIKSCSLCPELVASRRQAVPGDGAIPADIMFVGLAPGRNGADITGIPFTRDPSGKLFREMLATAELSDVFITNIVKCNPKDLKGRNRTPSETEIAHCSTFLYAEISLVRPKIIVALGMHATRFFLPHIKGMLNAKKATVGGITILPILHPSYVIRGAFNRDRYLETYLAIKKEVLCL